MKNEKLEPAHILPDPHRSEPWYEELREAHLAVLRQLGEDRDSLTTRDWMIIGAKWMALRVQSTIEQHMREEMQKLRTK